MTHKLKIKEKYLIAILNRKKTFEIRKNDRDFKVGDEILFTVVETGEEFPQKYTISYVLKDCPEYGLMDGYAILGIRDEYDDATYLLGDYILENCGITLIKTHHRPSPNLIFDTYEVKMKRPETFEVDEDDAKKLNKILDMERYETDDLVKSKER